MIRLNEMIIVAVLLCAPLIAGSVIRKVPKAVPRVIVDVDAGIDDYQALVYLLNADSRDEIRLEAIVVTDGNAKLKDVKNNVQRLLNTVGRTKEYPLYVGSSTVLSGEKQPDDWFGSDGFGNLEGLPPVYPVLHNQTAPVGIINIVRKFPNKVVYIALGPLTNLAITIRLFPEFSDLIKEVVVMGGNDKDTKTAEFNFLNDPEAVKVVLNANFKKPITLLSFAACMNEKMNLNWRWNVKIKSNPVWNLADRAERNLPNLNTTDYYNSCDPITVAVYLDPSLRTGENSLRVKVDTCDIPEKNSVRGRISKIDGNPNINFIHGFNADNYQKYFIEQFNTVCELHTCTNL